MMPHIQSKIVSCLIFHVSCVSSHISRYTTKELKGVLRARGIKVNT